ncbi:MAG: hypothetical protein HY508_00800 [Acidobacteria bacterium]|nr:hypothetical protein [Acidobacteriota bacterium]
MKPNTLTRKLFLVLAVGASLVFVASTAQAAETHNRLATNRLATNRLATNRLATNRLATNALSSGNLEANPDTAELLQTEDGREVYYYVVSCALPEGTDIQATIPEAPDSAPPDTGYTCVSGQCVFPGSLGLADYWQDRKLDPKGQRWITACLLARVNLHDTADAISLRGTAPSLTVGQGEAEIYVVQEGAFYGNIFTDSEDLDWNACRGSGQASGEFGGLALRDCAEPDPNNPGFTMCGLKYAGDCADFEPSVPTPYACRSFEADEGTYSDCHAEEGAGHWASRPYRQVITTYVSP